MLSQAMTVIAPLITAPYIARVFNAELIGVYSYTLANCSYFVLVESLGLMLYGQIKIAEVRDDEAKKSTVFYEIMALKIALMLVTLAAYAAFYVRNRSGLEYQIACVMMMNILAFGLDTSWFLAGLEEFKLIAIRSTVVRLLNIILVLTLVKDANDILWYAVIMQGAQFLSFLVLLPVAMKRTTAHLVKKLHFRPYWKPAAVYFVPSLITTIFSSTDKTMLGLLSGDFEVGVYEQANKISQIGMSAISAIGNVLMPRAAYLYHNGSKENSTDQLYVQSFYILAMAAFPTALGMAAIAKTFVPVFFGPGYEKSAVLLPILSANVVIVSFSNLSGQQLLIARNRQGAFNFSASISAIANVLLNLLMIRKTASIGAAFASVLSSLVALVMILKVAELSVPMKDLILGVWKYFCAAGIMAAAVVFVSQIPIHQTALVCVEIAVGVVVYAGTLLLLRDRLTLDTIRTIRSRLAASRNAHGRL